MPASCDYKRNGKASKLYNEAYEKYGFEVAEKLYLLNDTFKTLFPVGGEELTLKQVEDLGLVDVMEKLEDVDLESIGNQIDTLNRVFSAHGEGVEVEVRYNMRASAEISRKDGKNVLVINPLKLKADSAFHEFGHLYIDLLGEDHPLVKSGIKLLEGTRLWGSVMLTYPELTEEQLAKEVLTTAIGIEASRLFKDKSTQNRFKVWLNNFFRKIAELLGIEYNAVRRLADHLISGNLIDKFEGRLSTYNQRQKDLVLINNKFMTKLEFANKAARAIGKKIKIFYDSLSKEQKESNKSYQELSTLKEMLKEYLQNENDESIIAFVVEALDQTSKLEAKLEKLLNPLPGEPVPTAADIQNILNYNATFSILDDLQQVLENDEELSEYLRSKGFIKQIENLQTRYNAINNKAKSLGIKILSKAFAGDTSKTFSKRRKELEKEYNTKYAAERKKSKGKFNTKEGNKFRAEREKWIELKIETERPALIEQAQSEVEYLLQQTIGDISYLDRMFVDPDALNDELIQAASELLDRANMEVRMKSIKAYKEADELFKRFNAVKSESNQTKKYDEMLEDEVTIVSGRPIKTGKKSNNLISKYYSKFNDLYYEKRNAYYEAMDSGDEAEINRTREELEQFLKDNAIRRYKQEYYDALNSLPPDVQAKIAPLQDQKREILDKYRKATKGDFKNSYNPELITEEDRNALAEIEFKLKSLRSTYTVDGIKKEGEELRVAKELQDYHERLNEFYSSENELDNAAFATARGKAQREGREDEFMEQNTRWVPTDEFWELVDTAMGPDTVMTERQKELENLILPYKLPENKVNWKAIPPNILERIKTLQHEIEKYRTDDPGIDLNLWTRHITRITTKQYDEVSAMMKARGDAIYEKWYEDNHYKDAKGRMKPLKIWTKLYPKSKKHLRQVPVVGWTTPILKDEYINGEVPAGEQFIPNKNWENQQWKSMQARNDIVREVYDYFTNMIEEDDADIPNWAKLKRDMYGASFYRLPSVYRRNLERVLANGVVDTIRDRIKKRSSKDDSDEYGGDTADELAKDVMVEVITDEQNNEVRGVPINYRREISQEDQSHDLFSVFLMNKFMADNFKAKNEIAATLELLREFIKERDVVQTAPSFLKGRKIKTDRYSNLDVTGNENLTPAVKKGQNSNAYKAYVSLIEDQLYGISTLDTPFVNKITNFFASYTGNVLLIGNYLSAGANLLSGQSYNWLASAGGVHYTEADLTTALGKYRKDMPSIFGDIGNRVYKSKTNLLMEIFDSLGDWSAVANKFVEDNKLKKLFKISSLHALNTLAEHLIQNVVMYAVLNNIKVMDANGMYLTKTGVTDDVNKAMSLDEAYRVEGNKLVLDERVAKVGKYGENQSDVEFLISRKIKDLNAYLQGQYNSDKKSEIQRHWYGKLIMMLRKWMPRGLKYRWRGGQNALIPITSQLEHEFTSRALGTIEEGYYITTSRFLTSLYNELKVLKFNLASRESLKRLGAFTKETYAGLTDYEQGNLIKTATEAAYIISLYAIGLAIKRLADDEDDKMLYLASFYAIRVQREMLTFVNPVEFSKTLKSPSAVMIMVDRGIHLLGQLIFAPAETYKTGRRRGDLKLKKDFEDLIPLLKHINRDVEEALSWMISRRI